MPSLRSGLAEISGSLSYFANSIQPTYCICLCLAEEAAGRRCVMPENYVTLDVIRIDRYHQYDR